MRLFFQASALLLAIAVFPLPTNTGIALSTHSLHDIVSQNKKQLAKQHTEQNAAQRSARVTTKSTISAAQIAGASANSTADKEMNRAQSRASAQTSSPSAASSRKDVVLVQTDMPEPEPGTSPIKQTQQTNEPALSRTRPIKPQAVITTDFEDNGLSEASFRTVARVTNSEQPPAEKVLVIGDSLSIPLGKQLEEYFSELPGIHFKRLGKVSSGLARPDFFDWEKTLQSLAGSMKPSTVVIMIGTNDNQTLRGSTSSPRFGSSGWKGEYRKRISKLFDILHSNNPEVKIFWVGAPIMGKPDLTRDVRKINSLIESFCTKRESCHFIDTWDVLADDKGRFTSFMVDSTGERVRVRASDGIHLSHSGARILAGRCLQAMTPNIAVMQIKARAKPSG